MRNSIIKLSILVFILFLSSCKTENSDNKENGSPTYLGQKPPGLTPEPFAPGLVTTDGWEYSGVFSPDMKEFYFLRQPQDPKKKQEFVVFKNEGDTWSETVISSRKGQPFIAPDGKIMHLGKRFKERKENGEWSELKELQSPFDSLPIMRLTASSKGTYFFDEFKRDFTGDIRYSRLIKGKHQEPELLNNKINAGASFHPFIAPDESYLIFDSKREDGFGDSDIYITFRQQNGEWGDPINLGDKINTNAWEASASVTPDGKYLFFNRNMGSDNFENVDIFWVSTELIDKIRPKYTNPENQYFGQKPPGLTPEVFAPGLVSITGRFESTISFSPDLHEMYFESKYENQASQIYFSKLIDDRWTSIKKANFTKGNKKEEMHPFVSPDGKRLYFTAFDSAFSDEQIWYVNRLENTWSEATKLNSPINDDMVFFANHAKNSGLYYFNLSQFKTYYATNQNGKFIEPQEVDIVVGHHAFVSPNNDYLLSTARNKEIENRKDNDIYVHFKYKDGTWSDPINLGSTVNSNFSEKTPSISPDGKYLFFGRDERDIEPGLSNIYWVSTDVIEKLRPNQ
ncbi:MAG: hypothetical protein Tsb0034_20260 [Ekhidna sp.]